MNRPRMGEQINEGRCRPLDCTVEKGNTICGATMDGGLDELGANQSISSPRGANGNLYSECPLSTATPPTGLTQQARTSMKYACQWAKSCVDRNKHHTAPPRSSS
jgi:hypothetical protein